MVEHRVVDSLLSCRSTVALRCTSFVYTYIWCFARGVDKYMVYCMPVWVGDAVRVSHMRG
jgi:hypothetical protein